MEDPLFGQSLIANKPTTTTTPPRLNIHGDPMSQNKYVPSAVGHGRPTAVVLLYNKVPNLTPKEKRKILWPNSHVEHRRFLVSRKHIQSLSPRWNEYVKRNTHRHPVPLRLPQIVFQNEDPHALSLILYIAHHLTRCLPQSLTLDEIVNLAKISQRYDLNHILVGYLDQWLTPHRADILLPGYEKWLYVAWQFGIEADYVELANHLSKHCAVNARGRLLLPTTNEPIEDDGVFPPNALSLVHQARAKAFRELLTATQTFIREILLKPSCKLYEAPIAEQNACTARSSHGLQRYLAEHGILANAPGSKYLYSVWHLGRILTSHDVIEYMRQGGDEVTKHDDVCRVDSDLHDRVVKVVKGWSWAVNKEMITQLRTNAARRGTPAEDPTKMSNRLIEVGWLDAEEE